jgi:uncharacterized membrane protein YkoI
MRTHFRHIALAIGLALVAGTGFAASPGKAFADDDCGEAGYEAEEHDHERARHAVECGEVMPLADVLAAVRPSISGTIIETEFERDDGKWIYELTVIDSGGRLTEYHIDARTARILKSKGDE